jgi:O-phosphoseryl-tRNA(Cys) synthetase
VRAQIRKAFTSMGFEEMPTNNYVESRHAALQLGPQGRAAA